MMAQTRVLILTFAQCGIGSLEDFAVFSRIDPVQNMVPDWEGSVQESSN